MGDPVNEFFKIASSRINTREAGCGPVRLRGGLFWANRKTYFMLVSECSSPSAKYPDWPRLYRVSVNTPRLRAIQRPQWTLEITLAEDELVRAAPYVASLINAKTFKSPNTLEAPPFQMDVTGPMDQLRSKCMWSVKAVRAYGSAVAAEMATR